MQEVRWGEVTQVPTVINPTQATLVRFVGDSTDREVKLALDGGRPAVGDTVALLMLSSSGSWAIVGAVREMSGVGGPAVVPTGTLIQTISATQTAGWLNHDQTVTSADDKYPALWSVAPASWKSGTTLTIPDLTDVVLMGSGNLASLGGTAGSNTSTALLEHNHTATFSGSALPTHTHSAARPTIEGIDAGVGGNNVSSSSQPGDDTSAVSAGTPSGSVTVNDAGSGTSFSIVQSSLGVNIQIKT